MNLYIFIAFMSGVLFASLLIRRKVRELNRRLTSAKSSIDSLESRLGGLRSANDSLRSTGLVVEKNAALTDELAKLHAERQAAWGIPDEF